MLGQEKKNPRQTWALLIARYILDREDSVILDLDGFIKEDYYCVKRKKGCVGHMEQSQTYEWSCPQQGSSHCMELTMLGYGDDITINRHYCDY